MAPAISVDQWLFVRRAKAQDKCNEPAAGCGLRRSVRIVVVADDGARLVRSVTARAPRRRQRLSKSAFRRVSKLVRALRFLVKVRAVVSVRLRETCSLSPTLVSTNTSRVDRKSTRLNSSH